MPNQIGESVDSILETLDLIEKLLDEGASFPVEKVEAFASIPSRFAEIRRKAMIAGRSLETDKSIGHRWGVTPARVCQIVNGAPPSRG